MANLSLSSRVSRQERKLLSAFTRDRKGVKFNCSRISGLLLWVASTAVGTTQVDRRWKMIPQTHRALPREFDKLKALHQLYAEMRKGSGVHLPVEHERRMITHLISGCNMREYFLFSLFEARKKKRIVLDRPELDGIRTDNTVYWSEDGIKKTGEAFVADVGDLPLSVDIGIERGFDSVNVVVFLSPARYPLQARDIVKMMEFPDDMRFESREERFTECDYFSYFFQLPFEEADLEVHQDADHAPEFYHKATPEFIARVAAVLRERFELPITSISAKIDWEWRSHYDQEYKEELIWSAA